MEKQTLLDESIGVLVRLRRAYHGDAKTQDQITALLNKLSNLKY